MLLQLLRVKIQQLIVTESSESYPGSIALPDDLIEASGLKLFEQVHINNLTNGNRIVTYVVRSKKPGYVSLNGAASKLFKKGDKIHVLSYGYFEDELEWAMGDRYVRCCSREQSCNVFPGRITKYLDEINDLPTDINYYLCGKAIMVVEVRDLLISRGVPYENILAEIYF